MLKKAEARRIMAERDHAAMLRHPELWIWWPFLPLLKPVQDGVEELAVAVARPEGRLSIVRGANLFSAAKCLWRAEPITPDRVLAEGWLVD